ncbi:MAG: preprotein translocase subunit SecY [Candidatus Marinimicrobia bacterium]|jgi:preprotein translocase subunit SecY|nr:preprotein translocase subunit SecY [Candidatus Neomarinimicrobiota bacterium]MDP6456041.1 preprotein translocase subunit SecY [Candidatus Neomarinimicrobiota bacterium]MDP6592640.1 preprotein translocase subunit SecY [Candidatus Neomarinimicrobiota bacterium]MDP6836486.1 preprotein translocase subunit SecY [Candidatus Neomarinimicrobiota bacterium]|tara:strand:- start:7053 stop:8390 length:1338 start_codon:yes stop_codon:yes gene_type:complete
MIDKFRNIFNIPELRKRILFTLSLLFVVRVGAHVPVPGIDGEALGAAIQNFQNTLFGLYDLFAGGAFQKATLFALGIMPYISASIIIQLMGVVVPYFQRLQKEGEEGRKKITQLTRYGTVLISFLQSYGVAIFLENLESTVGGMGVMVVPDPGFMFKFTTMVSLVTGTVFIMWLGEQITERGIGNGISLIIMIGIVARLPNMVISEISLIQEEIRGPLTEIVLIGIMFVIVAFVVLITQGTRKIPVQYAKRIVGRKVYGGQSTHIPMRVNTAGVMPIIFAQSIMFLPSTVATFFQNSEFMQGVLRVFSFEHWFYWLVFGSLIVFFTYFYTAIAFNPVEVADNMKKHGGFIPGVRPGKKTSEFIDNILTRVTLPGSFFLAFIAVFPYLLMNTMDVSYNLASFFGGTSLLIIVGVALDTLQQIESHLLMRHYDGFLKHGKIRGRRRS